MPNGKLLFCPLIWSQGCSSCTILFLKSYSGWPLPTPTLLPYLTSKYCLWRMDSVSHLDSRLVNFDFRSSENKPISWSDLATTFTRIYRGGESFYKLVGKKTVILTSTGLICVYQRVVVVCDVSGNAAACLMKTAVWFCLEISSFCSVKAGLINVLLGERTLRTVCTILNNY